MTVYTMRRDHEQSDLLPGGRVPKDHFRTHVPGTVDRAISLFGLARAENEGDCLQRVLDGQRELLVLKRATRHRDGQNGPG